MKEYNFLKDEIKFFMEKAFQFAFVYIGVLFAVMAGTKLEVLKGMAELLKTKPDIVLSIVLLTLNLTYLTLATSSLYAILKRGYFILSSTELLHDTPLSEWEHFVRVPRNKPKYLDWNVDNYFMTILYLLIWAGSIVLSIYGISNSQDTAYILMICVVLLHLFPLWCGIHTIRLNHECRRLALNKST